MLLEALKLDIYIYLKEKYFFESTAEEKWLGILENKGHDEVVEESKK